MNTHHIQPSERTAQTIELALTAVEVKALEQWRRKFVGANIAHVVHYAMHFALLHPDQFVKWLECVALYCSAEDIDQFMYMRSRVAARYRTKRLKLARCQT
jgi:hypothetical protein